MSSIDLGTQLMCWKAKTHVLVIIGVNFGCGLAVIIGALIDYYTTKPDVSKVPNSAGKTVTELFGIIVLIFLMFPALIFCVHGCFSTALLCCKSKCCYGYYAILSFLAAGFGIYNMVSSFSGGGIGSLFSDSVGFYKISAYVSGGVAIAVILNTLYCAFVLCKLSYCDRSGGGADDLYSLDADVDVEKRDSETISERTVTRQLSTRCDEE